LRFYRGHREFTRRGTTPHQAYNSMRQLYVLTNGRFNDWMARREAQAFPPEPVSVDGVLGALNTGEAAAAADSIRRNGFHVFDRKLPADRVQEIVEYARAAPARYLNPEAATPTLSSELVRFDSSPPASPAYHIDEQSVFETEATARLIGDESLLAVAQEYLGLEPILDNARMWWSVPFGGRAKSAAAQLYHFDMDRLKFVKFFVYLTDVDEHTGPHCYVTGSHACKPIRLRSDGRKRDDEIRGAYPLDAFAELTGGRGTIIAVDTSGFHKGKDLTRGERLILQIEFATSRFGADNRAIRFTPEIREPLRRLRAERPRTYGTLFSDEPA